MIPTLQIFLLPDPLQYKVIFRNAKKSDAKDDARDAASENKSARFSAL